MKIYYGSILILLFFLASSWQSKAQEDNRFRRDCNYFSIYDYEQQEWKKWVEANNTFLINFNGAGDIKIFTPKGEVQILRNLGNKDDGETDDGTAYQSVVILGDDGKEGRFTLYSNGIIIIFYDDITLGFKP